MARAMHLNSLALRTLFLICVHDVCHVPAVPVFLFGLSAEEPGTIRGFFRDAEQVVISGP